MKKFFAMMFVAAMMFVTACTGNTNTTENYGVGVDSTEVVDDSLAVDSVDVELTEVVDSLVEVEDSVL